MYRCGFCGVCSASGQKQARVVTETRQRTYQNGDLQSIGFEIVSEVRGHPECVEKATNSNSVIFAQEQARISRIAGNAMRIRRFIADRQSETEKDSEQ